MEVFKSLGKRFWQCYGTCYMQWELYEKCQIYGEINFCTFRLRLVHVKYYDGAKLKKKNIIKDKNNKNRFRVNELGLCDF